VNQPNDTKPAGRHETANGAKMQPSSFAYFAPSRLRVLRVNHYETANGAKIQASSFAYFAYFAYFA
jgi:hypothetical protein